MYSKTQFFLGANSNIDFVSYFKQLQEQDSSMQLLILKGGPGSGKSSLMKRILAFADEKGHNLEIIPCASDPSSLDAVIDYTAKFAIMDGTAPHTEDPSLPGARHHILYTGDLWNCEKLYKNGEDIRTVNFSVSACHKSAGAYIKAAAALISENISYSESFLDKEKAASLAARLIKEVHSGKKGKEQKRLLSACSVGEVKVFSQTPSALADTIYIIEDKWGSAADFILKAVSSAARLDREPFIYCPCSIMPQKCDHLIFPEKRIAILTQNCFHKFSEGEKINGDDFYSAIPLVHNMELQLKSAKKLISSACNMIKDAKALHDDLEAFYVDAMDFDSMEEVFRSVIKKFY